MNTYKIYQIFDANKSEYSFRLPDSKKHVDFKSMTFGSKFADGKLIYGTDDAEIQAAIENMPKFKSGVITIEREVKQQSTVNNQQSTVTDADKQQSASGKKASGKKASGKKEAVNSKLNKDVDNGDGSNNEVIEVSEPTNAQEAKDWLKINKKIAPVALNSIEKVKVQAEKAGVTFPNVVWSE